MAARVRGITHYLLSQELDKASDAPELLRYILIPAHILMKWAGFVDMMESSGNFEKTVIFIIVI